MAKSTNRIIDSNIGCSMINKSFDTGSGISDLDPDQTLNTANDCETCPQNDQRPAAISNASVTAKHEILEWQHQSLQPQNQCMDQCEGIHPMQSERA